MSFEVVIGLEIHVQLLTRSKMFCACAVRFGAPPNTLTCPVCLGLPGSLPVLNHSAVTLGLRTALALGCTVRPVSRFHRKNYYYPDLPKNYQITQYQYKVHPPLATDGVLALDPDGGRPVRIRRVHLEEDTGRLVHQEQGGRVVASLIDYNRSGVPLMEIVTEPDLRSPVDARRFLSRLRAVLQTIAVSSGRLEEGTLRCDANVSLRAAAGELGIRTEVKNMNSLRSVEHALSFEADRQARLLASGERVVQETRHWDERRGVTFASRFKEEAHDYRYFPEPDLLPIAIEAGVLDAARAAMPELPDAKRRRYMERFGLSAYDAEQVTSSGSMAAFFEDVVALHPKPKVVSNWLTGDITAFLNAAGQEIDDLRITPAHVAELLGLIDEGTISGRTAKEVLAEMLTGGERAETVVRRRGLRQISDAAELTAAVDEVIAAHPGPVADFRAGKQQALTFLVGQVMRRTQGRANPEVVHRLLRERLSS
ncbi:MAG TPA: Asp-tRNA(Asn)/Glu-tRNA(Gln) amidotransferase subunit GatB [bacterium]|nr:Asp-tRNA(Asn)/Glu-tRNA(Gln) amidotransferase subunit GatB [bacterium]